MAVFKLQLEDYIKTTEQIHHIHSNSKNVYVIHYSCESFNDKTLPKVIAISLRNLDSGQTHNFSIDKTAAVHNIPIEQINHQYEQIEKELLDDYFDFLRTRQTCIFLHWHMTSDKFGFQAIEIRYKHLGGDPVCINDENKINLAKLLIKQYGYENREKLKIDNLAKSNYQPRSDYLDGKAEALAFTYSNYNAISSSTQLKTLILTTIFHKLRTVELITGIKSNWYKKRAVARSIYKVVDNLFVSLIVIIITLAGFGIAVFQLIK